MSHSLGEAPEDWDGGEGFIDTDLISRQLPTLEQGKEHKVGGLHYKASMLDKIIITYGKLCARIKCFGWVECFQLCAVMLFTIYNS